MITNDDGTFSFEDVTDYLQYGDNFGAFDLNAITNAIINECLKRTDVVDNFESTATDLPLSANMGRVVKDELYSIGSGTILGTHIYAGHWIYDANAATACLFIPLPLFYQNYDMTVTKIQVHGIGEYTSNIAFTKHLNGVTLSHASVTGTTHNGKLGIAFITFSEKTV
jgi:hypothetical protein